MITAFLEGIVEKAVINNWITHEEKEWLMYGLQQWIFRLIGIGIFWFVLGIFSGWLDATVFFLIFSWLRSCSGGWHASNPIQCIILSIALVVSIMWFSRYTLWIPKWILIVCVLVCAILIISFSPAECPNWRLTEEHRTYLKTKVFWRVILSVLVVVLAIIKWVEIAYFAAMGIFFTGVLVVTAKCCYKL